MQTRDANCLALSTRSTPQQWRDVLALLDAADGFKQMEYRTIFNYVSNRP
jgi:hypothetical protein